MVPRGTLVNGCVRAEVSLACVGRAGRVGVCTRPGGTRSTHIARRDSLVVRKRPRGGDLQAVNSLHYWPDRPQRSVVSSLEVS